MIVPGESTNNHQLYIVFLDQAAVRAGIEDRTGTLLDRARDLLDGLGLSASPSLVYDQLGGFAVRLTERQAQQLMTLGGVLSVEPDSPVFLEPPLPGEGAGQGGDEAARPHGVGDHAEQLDVTALPQFENITSEVSSGNEVLPWGVQAVWQGEDISMQGNVAEGSYAFVIDSGINANTGDLNMASNWHRSWVDGESPFEDGDGHGTHVAGTIAALANGIGVVGVAPGAEVVSLKVFDNDGGGASYSTIIAAINHAAAVINESDNNSTIANSVINMSLAGGLSSSLDTAVKNAAASGIRFAISAGNSGDDVDRYSPAASGDHPLVFTVSAVDSAYRMPSWSNWDRISSNLFTFFGDSVDDVDLAAPGVSVVSLGTGAIGNNFAVGDGLASISGTSMAAPHVAGLLLLGGAFAGDSVIPYYTNTADPFAIGDLGSWDDEASPSPDYALSSPEFVEEGSLLEIRVDTTNVDDGTPLYWELDGDGISPMDFDTLSDLQGEFTISDGFAILRDTVSADLLTEGDESLVFRLFSESERSNELESTTITIVDTSIEAPGEEPGTTEDLVLWGTTGNDIIIGGSGNDQIAGVPETGVTSNALGRGQIDTLTGNSGADLFVLGVLRGGVARDLYDDGRFFSAGEGDYALITDFDGSEGDRIQLAGGNYSLRTDDRGLMLYRASLFGGGELIAILQGVEALSVDEVSAFGAFSLEVL